MHILLFLFEQWEMTMLRELSDGTFLLRSENGIMKAMNALGNLIQIMCLVW
jgi:hypothetical protein